MNAFMIPSRFVCRVIAVALSVITLSPLASAEYPHPLNEDACQLRPTDREELCGWVYSPTRDSIAYRSMPVDLHGPVHSAARPIAQEDTEEVVTRTLAITAATFGFSVEQWLEPLALVAPYVDNSLEKIRQYGDWLGDAAMRVEEQHRQQEETALNAILLEEQLARVATEEPIDTEALAPTTIPEDYPIAVQLIPEGEPGIEVLPLNRLVGSSAMIMTIEEEGYMPYDLCEEDLRLWSVLPESTHPFCIRPQDNPWDTAEIWKELDKRVARRVPFVSSASDLSTVEMEEVAGVSSLLPVSKNTVANTTNEPVDGSPYCMIESLVWRAETWVSQQAVKIETVNAVSLGRQVAVYSLRKESMLRAFADRIVLNWKFDEFHVPIIIDYTFEASPAGSALLARAGAIEATSESVNVAAGDNRLR